MDRKPVPGAARHNKGRKRRRQTGLAVIERDGFWHIHGTLLAQGRSVRVRQSTRLQAHPDLFEDADKERTRIERELRGELAGRPGPGPFLSIAAEAYLNRKRKRPLGKTTVEHVRLVTKEFGLLRMREITNSEWTAFVDVRMASNASTTRERFVNSVVGFTSFCAAKPRHWCDVPFFDRDKEARNPRRRARRAVGDLRPHFIAFMLEQAAPHLKPQLWTEWSTGARVSSILHGCALSDVNLAPGREQITFRDTKNGDTVTAVLHSRAAQAIREYLEIRGRLHDREGPLFRRPDGKPYSGKHKGTANKTAFNSMKRRARRALRRNAVTTARDLITQGLRKEAAKLMAEARAAHRLIGRITQHWFRHMLATSFRGDIKAAMDQGGWRDERSVMGYISDAPEHRRQLVARLDDGEFGTSKTRDDSGDKKKEQNQ